MEGVSIVICTYNGKRRLAATLDSCLNQKFDLDYGLIVVDNASTDGTFEFLQKYKECINTSVSLSVVSEPKQGLSFARKTGVLKSAYDFILFCDDDNWLSPDFLALGFEILKRNPAIGVLGSNGTPEFEITQPKWFDRFSHSYAVGTLGKKEGKQAKGSYHYGASCFFRKEPLLSLYHRDFQSLLADRSGRDLSSGGDVELCLAVQLLGYELHFSPNLRFKHFIEAHRLSWDYYLTLKKGIAQSYPLLTSYQFQDFKTRAAYRSYLLVSYFTTLKGVLKTAWIDLLFRSKENTVANVTSRVKTRVFWKNYRNALSAFEKNRVFFDA